MSYVPSTNKDYLRRIQYTEGALGTDNTFLNVGFVSRFNSTLTNDREVIRELGFEDIGYDLKLGEVITAELGWRAVDPTMVKYCMALCNGAGTPEKSINILENCRINNVSKYFLTQGLKPTRLSLTYARMLELSANFVGISQSDALSEAQLEAIVVPSVPGAIQYAGNITTAPWSNLAGNTTTPVTVDSGSGFVAYPNISFSMDVGRAIATNQPSGNATPTHIDVTNREITGSWTTILKDDPFYTAVKNGQPLQFKIRLKAGATPCDLSLTDLVFNSYPRVSDAGSTTHRQITFGYQAKLAAITAYVP